MENKYYTPEIEDLHFGLECEILKYSDKDEEFFESCILDNIILKNLFELSILHKDLDNWLKRTIRIKCLNKKDIESFGWDFCGKNYESADKEDIYRIYNNDDLHTEKYQLRKYSDYKIVIKFGGIFTIFCGNIKNKSELKKLLVQLDIFYL